MQTTSLLYKQILADPSHVKEWKVSSYDGDTKTDHYSDEIVSIRKTSQLYGNNLIGNVCSASLDVVLRGVSSDTIPNMAKITVEVRLARKTNGQNEYSEWLPKGVFWVNTREDNTLQNTLTLHCVDGMMLGERDFYLPNDPIESWTNKTMREVALLCAEKMDDEKYGVTLEDPNVFQNVAPYRLTAPPEGYTVRQVLSGIAVAHCGNIIMTNDNKIRLVPFIPTDTGIDLNVNVSDFTLNKQYKEFGQVIFNFEDIDGGTSSVLYPDLDEEDVEGPIIEVTLNAVTDSDDANDIVENVYNALGHYLYTPFNAQDAILDPAMELGDGITINDTYVLIGSLDETCDDLYSASITTQSFEETENEFKYKTKSEKNIERKIAKTSASFRVGIDGIEALVTGLAPEWKKDTSYKTGDLVRYNDQYYTCLENHTSGSTFDSTKWSEGVNQATLTNAIKLNIIDGLVLSSDAGSDTNSCYIQLKYGNITLFGEEIYMNNVRADSLSAQTINAKDVSLSGALSVYGSLNYPAFKPNVTYNAGDRIYDRVLINPLTKTYKEGIWECNTTHVSADTLLIDIFNWDFIENSSPLHGGYVGFGSGKVVAGGVEQPTPGVVLSSAEQTTYDTNAQYIIVTNSGVRLQSGVCSLFLSGGHIRYTLNGTDIFDLGAAVFT